MLLSLHLTALTFSPALCRCCHLLLLLCMCILMLLSSQGVSGEMFATIERALDERTIGHNPERLNLMKVG